MLLMEVFDKPVKWTKGPGSIGEYNASFKIGKIEYDFVVQNRGQNDIDGEDVLEMEFYSVDGTKSSSDITNSGNAIAVFATIKDIVKSFVSEVKPNIIMFTAKEESRVRLYDRMSKMIEPLGFDLTTEKIKQGKEYMLYRKG